MHAIILSFFALLPGAPAQGYGYGAYGALNCDLPYQPAAGAVNAHDLLLNNQGLVRHSAAQLDGAARDMARLNQALAQDRAHLQQVMGAPAILALDQHQRFGGGAAGYRPTCGAAPAVAGPVLPAGYANLQPTPAAFCVNGRGGPQNLWTTQFAGPNGVVNEIICDYQPGYRAPQPPPRAAACRRHLRAYYQRLAAQAQLQRRIGELNTSLSAYRIEEQQLRQAAAEAGVCLNCQAPPRSFAGGQGGGNGIAPIMQILMSVLGGNRGGAGPGNGGGGFGGGQGPYPSIPYQARMRGYYNPRGVGGYGTIPGGIGRGAFAGCGGPGALGLGAQFAPAVQPLGTGAPHPFAPQYSNDLIDPTSQNALFNPGFGAGFGPGRGGQPGPPDVLPLLGNPNLAGQLPPPRYGFGQTPAFGTNQFFGNQGPYTQFGFGAVPQPNVSFAQAPRYAPYAQAPGNLLGVQSPGFAPPPVLQMNGRPFVPAFGVGQGVGANQNYANLNYLAQRAQYGFGVPPPPPPPVLPMVGGTGALPVAQPLPGPASPVRPTGPPASLPAR